METSSGYTPKLMMTGLIGNEGFEIKARLEGDRLLGRVGGALMGKDLSLDLSDTGVTGTVGGKNGAAVQLSLETGELVGFIGADRVALRGVDQVSGEIGTGVVAIEMRAVQRGDALEGRVGGLTGKAFSLQLDGLPGWIGALVAVTAYCALERIKT
jgi:hypothetical protein